MNELEESAPCDFADVLPLDMQGRRGELESMGVVFGQIMANRMLIRCVLPSGWSKRPTGCSIQSELVDDQQRVRARIFYKPSVGDYVARLEIVDLQ